MLNQLHKTTDKVFNSYKHGLRNNYLQLRKRTATKLNNPRINDITLHTFRHYKATMEYHKTHDILHVQAVLGHRNIQTTMIYVTIENSLYMTETTDFTAKVAHNEKEILELIEQGWEKVTEYNGTIIFRKRK